MNRPSTQAGNQKLRNKTNERKLLVDNSTPVQNKDFSCCLTQTTLEVDIQFWN